MDDPLIDSLTADEQQGAAELMASVDFRKLGGDAAAVDRGPSGQREEVDQSTLLSTVHVGSSTMGEPVGETPLPQEFTEAEYARTASVQRSERNAEQTEDAARDSLTYSEIAQDLVEDSRHVRGRRERASDQRDANLVDRPGDRESETGSEINSTNASVGRIRESAGDGEFILDGADGSGGANMALTAAVGEAPDPLLGLLGTSEFGPGQSGPGQLGPGEFGLDRFGLGEFGLNQFGPSEFGLDRFGPDRFDPDPFGPDPFSPDPFGHQFFH